ncbi:outer membrane protein assembly factor [Candidatus Sumerlaeota bacterium]|nr:outer membrane protein assembly factor [Candidatus Sumerlaeota bacterium]
MPRPETPPRLLTLALTLSVILCALPLGAAPIIQSIRIEGLESIGEQEILPLLQSEVGAPLDTELLQADQRTILGIGIFRPESTRVFVEDLPSGDVNLIFTVRENPTLVRIEILGNISESTERLLSLIESPVGERMHHQADRQARDAIADYYERRGHSQVRVLARLIPEGDEGVALRVEIDEGQVLEIGEVRIEGNETFGDRRLRWHMSTKSSGLFGTNHFSEEIFETDLLALQQFYLERGFLDARVERGEFEYDSAEGRVHPAVVIHEGPRHRFDGITVRGNTLFTDLEITEPFARLSGDWFDAGDLRERIEQVQRMYADEGHINAVIEPRLDPDPTTGVVSILLDVREGPRVTIGAIYLQRTTAAPDLEAPGLSWISRASERLSPPITDDTIRRIITLEEGEVYRGYEEVRTRDRLRRLGIFDSVAIDRRPTSDPTVEDVHLTIDQRSTGFLTVGAGLGDESGLFGFVNLTENNFGGEADQIRASVQIGTRSLNFDVTYFNRFLADTEMSLRLSAYDSELRRSEYDEERTGTFAELGQPLSEHLEVFYRLRTEYVSFDLDNGASSRTHDAMDSYWLTLARVRLVEDRRSDVHWPTEGWLRGVSLEAGWADDWLVKIFGEFQHYRTIWRDVILALNLEAGVIPRDLDDVAFGERFFLGGSEDLRGFDFRGAGPTDSSNDDLFIGGTTKVLSQVEIRFPIWERLRGVAFADVGSIGEDPFTLDPLRASVGLGLRFALPGIGFLALDFAQAVVTHGDDETQLVHFTFRTDFEF